MIYRLCICIFFTTGIQLTNYKIKITNMENPEIRWESMCKLSFGWLCVTPVRSHKTVSWRQATREYHLTSCTELLQTTPSPIRTKIPTHMHLHAKHHMYITCIHMYPWPDFIKPNLCALLWAHKFLLSESQQITTTSSLGSATLASSLIPPIWRIIYL